LGTPRPRLEAVRAGGGGRERVVAGEKAQGRAAAAALHARAISSSSSPKTEAVARDGERAEARWNLQAREGRRGGRGGVWVGDSAWREAVGSGRRSRRGGDAVHGGRCGASGWKSWGGGSRGDEHGIWELIAGDAVATPSMERSAAGGRSGQNRAPQPMWTSTIETYVVVEIIPV
jgi:hypothetical protein